MNILIAPDSYKGSLSAIKVTKAIENGLNRNEHLFNCLKLPMADGGEGTIESLVNATNGKIINVGKVTGPNGTPVNGYFGVSGDKQEAVIELAVASGIAHIYPNKCSPALTTTYGSGEIIKHALDLGYRNFILCLGGSATNDAGTGLLSALGIRFLDKAKKQLPFGGLALRDLAEIDCSELDQRINVSYFKIANDVKNPLTGKDGASYVFAPQKGASKALVRQLENSISCFADKVAEKIGVDLHNLEGAGSAGGTAGGAFAFLPSEFSAGIDVVKQAVHFDNRLKTGNIDCIITGEGRLDNQTEKGKVIAGILNSAKPIGVPVIAIAGCVTGDQSNLYKKGLTSAFSIVDGPISLEESISQTEKLISKVAENIGRTLFSFSTLKNP